MTAVLFLLNVLSFSLGVFNVVSLSVIRLSISQKGLRILLLPGVPLLLMTLLQVFHYYIIEPGNHISPTTGWSVIYETMRILISMGWIAVAYYHYFLNGIDRFRKGQVIGFGILGFLSWTALLTDILLHGDLGIPEINNYVVVGILFFAGIKGVLILNGKPELLESSKLAVVLAAVSLTIYPVVALADAFTWRLGFLYRSAPVWIQLHPVYYIILNIPITVYLAMIISRRAQHQEETEPTRIPSPADQQARNGTIISWRLSSRETEVLELLLKGCRNQKIAEELFLSLSTVKTHIAHIYEKAGVSSRGQLFAVLSGNSGV